MLSPAQFQGGRAGRELCAQCKRELFFEGHRAHNCSKSQQTKKKKGERKCHDCAQGLGALATGQGRISDIFGASAQNTGNTDALVATASPSSPSFSVSNALAAAMAPNSTPTLEPTPFQSAADVSVATRMFMETSRANQTLHEARAHAPHDHVVAKFEEWRARGGMTLDLNTNSSSQRIGGKTILRSVGTRVPIEFRQHFQANIMGKDVELRNGMQWERDGYRRPAAIAEYSFIVKVDMKNGGIDHGRPMWRAFGERIARCERGRLPSGYRQIFIYLLCI